MTSATSLETPLSRVEVLAPDGTLQKGKSASMSDHDAVEALRWMLLSRTVDTRGVSLQRQGRMGTFSPVRGQEASVVGSSLALDPANDWIAPAYREMPALIRHGLPLERFFLYWMGNPAGGRIPDDVNVLPFQIALAAQLPHAVGLAWGLKRQGFDGVVMTYFGDGASSEGDAHEALNLAGVVRAPVVFVLQNNGWAISTPRSKQSAARSLASRAEGYGFPGVVVDGNDLFALYEVALEAVNRAREGAGPTLIESMTSRMGPHNTADDPTRYLDADETSTWDERDPILRVTRYLTLRGFLDDERLAELQADVDAEVDAAIAAAEAFPSPHAAQLFDHVYERPDQRLRSQHQAASRRRV